METKHFLASKTFWGAALVLLATGANLLGFEPEALPTADEIVAIIGGVIAIIGRFTAKTVVTL